uniref:Uncharacterized protein n=1 Tax=Siphoviridae sp. ctXX925 TaxID=2826370 RepID=A0A8S5R237_9CAUD|nr:MAG TPA: hypothetical protein [Siphoviridae sp. ctXX925]
MFRPLSDLWQRYMYKGFGKNDGYEYYLTKN